jgi:large repetitive protein
MSRSIRSVSIAITFSVRDNTTFQNVVGVSSVSSGGQLISFVPDAPFAVGRSHSVIVNSLVVDLAGNRLSTGSFNFTTGFDADTTAPQVQEIAPAAGLTAVPTNTSCDGAL